jgi:hypothetical protein
MAMSAGPKPRGCSAICLPFDQDACRKAVADPVAFRLALDRLFRLVPELFPEAFAQGYTLKDSRFSKKLGLVIRRIECKTAGEAFSIRPSFALPYMAGLAPDVQGPLFLRCFGVPFWALAKVFGKDHDYWYRLEVALGRASVAGTTLRKAGVPEHLLADEHHQTRDGQKRYTAATVAEGCFLGAQLAPTAGEDDLQAAYAVFKEEAQDIEPGYAPTSVNTDGWAATRAAWMLLFPLAAVLRCFLHAWLAIRSRGKLNEHFPELSRKTWHAYWARTARSFSQRLRRLLGWARRQGLPAWLMEQVQKLCGRSKEYQEAYKHPGSHRTSNMPDRAMRAMNRYNESGQHLHGSHEACRLHARAWALLFNFRDWHPATARANEGKRCPAERLNGHRYHGDWLQNLLVHASLNGYRRRIAPPQTP